MIGRLNNLETLVEKVLEGETDVLGENPFQCHYVNLKFYTTRDQTRTDAVGSRPKNYCNDAAGISKSEVVLRTYRY
jgi:hypothetical protein